MKNARTGDERFVVGRTSFDELLRAGEIGHRVFRAMKGNDWVLKAFYVPRSIEFHGSEV